MKTFYFADKQLGENDIKSHKGNNNVRSSIMEPHGFPAVILHLGAQDDLLEAIPAQSEPHALCWKINLTAARYIIQSTYISSTALSKS